jgi:CheY-specific phosphatase CheX
MHDETLQQVAEDTFASMAFLFPAFDEADAPSDSDAAGRVAAEVDFTGPMCGTLTIDLGEGVLVPLAANMLAIDEPDRPSAEQQFDALKELLNVICGNLLPQIGGDRSVFNVGAPRVGTPGSPLPQGQPVELMLDCGCVNLWLDMPTGAQV